MENQIFDVKRDEDIQIYHYGMEKCENGHSYGPAVRDHFLIHFILEGKGIYKTKDKIYNLEKRQGFLIVPEEITYYEADIEEPWVYCWIGFNGWKANQILKDGNLTFKNPILTFGDASNIPKIMEEMLNADIKEPGGSLKLKALLYMILSDIQRINFDSDHQSTRYKYTDEYVEEAMDYIHKNYSRDIKITDVAKYIGFNRSYFSKIFKENTNISPQSYLIQYRMKKAAELLNATSLMIGDIARSTGYSDALCFSKVFKSVMGVSPSKYRENISNEINNRER